MNNRHTAGGAPRSRQAATGRWIAGFGARALLAGCALLLVAVPFGLLLLLVQGRWGPLLEVDEAVRDGLHGYARSAPLFVTTMKVVSAFGTSGAYLILFGAVAGWLLARRSWRLAAFCATTVAGGVVLNTSVKALVDRARPRLPDPVAFADHSSFPSGHAQGVVVAVGVLLYVLAPALPRRRSWLVLSGAALWVLLVGFSRLALGVHYVSDVLAGYVLGLAWLAMCTAALGSGVWPARTVTGGDPLAQERVALQPGGIRPET